jgi:hypothetical protein
MSNKGWVVAAGLGLGLSFYYNLQSEKSAIAQSCVLEDTKTVPGMVFLKNGCPFSINVHACRKILLEDITELFGSKSSGYCTNKEVEPGKPFFYGNMYQKNAGWLWNAASATGINYMACKAPKSPERTEGPKFICK